jgi:hypothetical protein
MRAIEHALSARREYLTKDGRITHGGPDHYARLAATKHFRDFLMASRPAPKQPEQKNKTMTLQEIEDLLRANKECRCSSLHSHVVKCAKDGPRGIVVRYSRWWPFTAPRRGGSQVDVPF